MTREEEIKQLKFLHFVCIVWNQAQTLVLFNNLSSLLKNGSRAFKHPCVVRRGQN